ncbi:RNA polymerase sigma-70 factor [Dysgonomonas sp. Marseille-P4677]|uniref:RNA polymerase sigma-70 factor n=1 Tax=Dysgonomonas sp. Marseille-P4677 TaxID=2364790 RepID=UPI0019131518|nr:RNA polymerase sigma-70 factor [Dysgonomonas sp. Marseille-P4677]MBK5720896.1 RNA polymerase sigma-70 factor [Dysgonomonas sp. Marseille-P4677]
MLNDLLVLKKIKEGDIKTFEEVFRNYYASLCFYSFSITNRKDIAEEIVQELFYVLWKDRQEIQVLRSVKNYLYGAVRNQSLQYLEHRDVQERHRQTILQKNESEQDLTPDLQMEYKELENVINRTLKQLPERRLRIFKMHRLEGKKYKEIAEYFAVSVKTIEAEMTKAYQVLRHEIEKYSHVL